MVESSSASDLASHADCDITQQVVVTLSFETFSRLVERAINERQSHSNLISQILDNTR